MLAEALAAVPGNTAAVPTRTIRLGIVGLGNVGQAVARLTSEVQHLKSSGLRFRVAGALVRDIDRPRRCPRPSRLTTNPAAFLRGHYDVVIEALGVVEPARAIVARLLGRGIPVVTANKALVAAHGPELVALAARRGTSLRYEASALAGVPFLGALSERPFVSDVSRFVAVVNGTSNFILSTLDAERCPFDRALANAQRLGLTEPDPSRDLDGADAADKFSLLTSVFGWGRQTQSSLEVQGIRGLDAADLAAAARLDATIKPIAWAARVPSGLEAFVGPALVPARHPLASLAGSLSGIQLSGRFVSDLFFSGPGAGPDITAATILDDAVEAVSTMRRVPHCPRRAVDGGTLTAPVTEWFVRVRFPAVVPEASAAQTLFAAAGLPVPPRGIAFDSLAQAREVPRDMMATRDAADGTRWLRVGAASRSHVDQAIGTLRHTHRIDCHAIRAL